MKHLNGFADLMPKQIVRANNFLKRGLGNLGNFISVIRLQNFLLFLFCGFVSFLVFFWVSSLFYFLILFPYFISEVFLVFLFWFSCFSFYSFFVCDGSN